MAMAGVSESTMDLKTHLLSCVDCSLERLKLRGYKIDSRLGRSVDDEFDMVLSIHADPSCRGVFGKIEDVVYSMERNGMLRIREAGCKTVDYEGKKRFSPVNYDLVAVNPEDEIKRIGIIYDEMPEF